MFCENGTLRSTSANVVVGASELDEDDDDDDIEEALILLLSSMTMSSDDEDFNPDALEARDVKEEYDSDPSDTGSDTDDGAGSGSGSEGEKQKRREVSIPFLKFRALEVYGNSFLDRNFKDRVVHSNS